MPKHLSGELKKEMKSVRRGQLPIVILVMMGIIGCNTVQKKIASLKSEMNVHLRLGSTSTEVIAYLDRNHIEHTEYIDAGDDQEVLRLNGAPGRISGIIRNVSSGLFYRSDIRLIFLFDAQGRLLSYDAVEAVTSL